MTTRVFLSVMLAVLTSGWSCQMPKSQMLVLNAEASPASFGLSCDDRQTWKTGNTRSTCAAALRMRPTGEWHVGAPQYRLAR